jgi:lysozyme family protein
MTDDEIIERVLRFEGGFVNNPLDKGGPTNFGITAAELGRARKWNRSATIDEIKDLSRAEAISIYKQFYITAPKFDQVPDGKLRMIVVDSAVLHGVSRATKWLQKALNVSPDGVIGRETIKALNHRELKGATTGKAVLAQRFKFIGTILKNNPSQAVFASGWLNRVADLLQFA